MLLSDISIRRPVFAWMITLGLMFFGLLSFQRLGVSLMPELTAPGLFISVIWPGAAPKVMENEIVNPIEEAVISSQGITDIGAQMRQGFASIYLIYSPNKSIDAAFQETNSKLRGVKLPDGALRPVINRVDTDDSPILWVDITTSQRSLHDLIVYTELHLRDRFVVLPGVSNIIQGWQDRNLRIWVDNHKLVQNQLTILDVKNTLLKENAEVASGYIENDQTQFNVRTMAEALTPEQIGNLRINQRGDQRIYQSEIRIRDVATVEDDLNDQKRFTRTNGVANHISVGIRKQQGANEIAVAASVKEFIDQVNQELETTAPDLHVLLSYDGTRHTAMAIKETEFTLLLCIVITGLVCWLFLGSWSSTSNVLLSIPTSILGTCIMMDWLGFTLNYFTLLGLSLGVGIVVDDSIMVLENIVRHFHQGKTAHQAARDGAREITFAAIAATAAVVAVFSPLIFYKAIPIVGICFFQFGLTLSMAVSISLLEAITLTPMRCAQFMTLQQDESWMAQKMNSVLNQCSALYRQILDWCLNRRWFIVIGSLLLFILSLASIHFIPLEAIPKQDDGLITINYETLLGSSIKYTLSQAEKIEETLKSDPRILRFMVSGGGDADVNQGFCNITLKALPERFALHQAALLTGKKLGYTKQEIIDDLRSKLLALYPNKELVPTFSDDTGKGGGSTKGKNVELGIRGPDYTVLKEKADEMVKRFKDSGLMVDVDTDYRDGDTEIEVTPDRENAALSGVSVQDIAATIDAAIGGVRPGKFTNGNRRYDINLRLLPEQWSSIDDVNKLLIRTQSGELIPLTSVTHVTAERKLHSISREKRQHVIHLYANAATGKSPSEALSFAQKTAREVLPDNYHLDEVGTSKELVHLVYYSVLVLILGLISLYIILAIQFNSFTQPISIMSVLLFTFTGAFLALLLTHNSLNFFSIIGILVLMGIATKNSILLVDFFNKQHLEKHLSLRDAILVGAPIRLRPIIMTSAATILAMLPLACGAGPGAEVRGPLGIVIIGGIAVSTVFSLVVVPCLYSLLAPWELDQNVARRELDNSSPNKHHFP